MASVGSFFSNMFGGDASDRIGHCAEAVCRGCVVVTVQDETAATRAQSALASCGPVNSDALADSMPSQYPSLPSKLKPNARR